MVVISICICTYNQKFVLSCPSGQTRAHCPGYKAAPDHVLDEERRLGGLMELAEVNVHPSGPRARATLGQMPRIYARFAHWGRCIGRAGFCVSQ